MGETVTLRHYQEEDKVALEQYVLSNAQYTIHPSDKVKELAFDDRLFPLVICYEQQIVGFFCLNGYPATEPFTDNPEALLFRSLSTDERYRGQGYGKAGMLALADFIGEEFPTCNEVVLAVNHQNRVAQTLYLALGFEDTNKRLMGPLGEQFVYSKRI